MGNGFHMLRLVCSNILIFDVFDLYYVPLSMMYLPDRGGDHFMLNELH